MFIKDEITKTIYFFVLDILMVLLYTYLWFHLTGEKNVLKTSIMFTTGMQIFFLIYYFIYDYIWDNIHYQH